MVQYTLPFLYWRLESLHDHRYYFPGNFRSKDSYTTSLEQEKLRLQRVIAELRKAPDFEGSLEINSTWHSFYRSFIHTFIHSVGTTTTTTTVIEGVNLGKGKKVSDPFCVCELGMQRVRTKIKRKTRSPQWNEKFILYVVVVVYRTRVRNPTHQPTKQPTDPYRIPRQCCTSSFGTINSSRTIFSARCSCHSVASSTNAATSTGTHSWASRSVRTTYAQPTTITIIALGFQSR